MDKDEPSKITAKTQKQLDKAATQKKREEVALQKNAEKQLKASRKTIKVRMPKATNTKKTAKPLNIANCQELMKEEDAIINAINNYKRNGISVLDHLQEETLLSMLEKANDVYRNLGPNDVLLMNDKQYDI